MALKNKGMGRRVILDSNKMWCVGFVLVDDFIYLKIHFFF